MNFFRLFEKKTIDLEVDQQFNRLNGYDVSNLPRTIEFYIWELIFSYGAKKSSKFNPTFLNKLFAFDYLVERILIDRDFKICINRIRGHFGSEELKSSSESYGEAFALLLVQKLFNTKLEKVEKILATGKRADYQGQTEAGDTIAFEAKGTISNNTLISQRRNGKVQLNQHTANIKTLFGTLVQEGQRSKVVIDDPPGQDFQFSRREMMAIEAEGMARLFNFLGHKELAKYFSLMNRRLSNERYEEVVDEKERLFQKIKTKYETLIYGQRKFKGHITKISGKYIFVGIDESLIYYREFLNARIDDEFKTDKTNNAILYKDKILVKQMDNLSRFENEPEYFNFLDRIDINDFHYLPKDACISLLIKIFNEVGLKVLRLEDAESGMIVIGSKRKSPSIVFFVKFFSSSKKDILIKVDSMMNGKHKGQLVLITPNRIKFEIPGIKIIDRPKLKSFLLEKDRFLEFF